MIKPRFVQPYVAVFETLFWQWMRTRLKRPEISSLESHSSAACKSKESLIIFVANHTSWFDGFLIREMQKKLFPNRDLYSVMLRRERNLFPILWPLGTIGIDPGKQATTQLIQSLEQIQARNQRPKAITIFPQAEIQSSAVPIQIFHSGFAHIAKHFDATVVPVSIHIEPLQNIRPQPLLTVGRPMSASHYTADALVSDSKNQLQYLLDHTKNMLKLYGEKAPALWRNHAPYLFN